MNSPPHTTAPTTVSESYCSRARELAQRHRGRGTLRAEEPSDISNARPRGDPVCNGQSRFVQCSLSDLSFPSSLSPHIPSLETYSSSVCFLECVV